MIQTLLVVPLSHPYFWGNTCWITAQTPSTAMNCVVMNADILPREKYLMNLLLYRLSHKTTARSPLKTYDIAYRTTAAGVKYNMIIQGIILPSWR